MNEFLSKPKILFVDDEESIISGLKRILYPYKNEWDLYFALSGMEALKIMEETPVNMIISDMRMPGMTGAELLLQVQQKYPETIRMILSGHSDEELIIKSVKTAHRFFSKPCDPALLVETIKNTFYLRSDMHNEVLLKIINGIDELPTLPKVYLRLVEELNSNNVSLNRIASLISEDLNISAKILHIVNSAFFSLPVRVADMATAVNLLGVDTIKSLILFLQLHNKNVEFNSQQSTVDSILSHSLLVAKASEIICKAEGANTVLSREAYIAGLLHDVGKIVLVKYPGYKNEILSQNFLFISEKEYQNLGVSHAEVGAYLLGVWNLPDQIIEAVAFHHRSERIASFNINVAVYYANLLIKGEGHPDVDIDYLPLENKLEKWRPLIKNIV